MRIAVISYHTCPLATLGGKHAGGMNVYVRDLSRYLGRKGIQLDVFTRSQDEHVPHVLHDLGFGNRVAHITAGAEHPLPKKELTCLVPEFADHILDFARKKKSQIRFDPQPLLDVWPGSREISRDLAGSCNPNVSYTWEVETKGCSKCRRGRRGVSG